MKKVSILAVAAFAMFSCSKNVNVNDQLPKGNTIGMEAVVNQLEKGSYTELSGQSVTLRDGDKFGVYMYNPNNSPNPSVLANNVEFTYVAANEYFTADYGSGEGAKLTWEGLIGGNPTALSFYSYYPYDSAASDATAITVSVPETQTMGTKSGNKYTVQRTVTEKDFIYSDKVADGENKTEGIAKSEIPADRTVRFFYKHALSVVELNIVKSVAIAATKDVWFEKATITGDQVYKDGTIDITADDPAITPGSQAVSGLAIPAANAGTDSEKLVSEEEKNNTQKAKVRYQMLVVPASISDNGTDAKFSLDIKTIATGGQYASAEAKTVTGVFPQIDWEAGNYYKYNVIVNENNVVIDLIEIEDWNPVEGGDLPATPEII